jgi:retron-type reverse transcriptase
MRDWKAFLEQNVNNIRYRTAFLKYVERLSVTNFPVIFCLDHLSALVGIKLKYLAGMVIRTDSFYREFSIPKRNGGERIISAPYPSLLSCQKWIVTNITSKIPVHESAHGFVSQHSIVSNAEPHLGCNWLLKIDIKDFFPSINIRRIVWIFKQCGYTRDVSFFLARLCTLDGNLPQGSAASPTLSNIIFNKTDKRLAHLANCWKVKYTRYADDLTFSGRYVPLKFIDIVYEILQSEGFIPNKEKTRLIGPKGRKIVTGVSVSGNMLKLPKETKRQVRKEAYYLWRLGFENHTKKIGSYDPIYMERLLGKLAFWKQIEPDNQYVNQSIERVQVVRAQLDSLGN